VVVIKSSQQNTGQHRCTLSVPALITIDLRLWLHNLRLGREFADLPTTHPCIVFQLAGLEQAPWGKYQNALSHEFS
jgi:hypothetical protein